MRVISGKAKGTKLKALEGDSTRPTLDRVKEALFNIIQNEITDALVLDLFAGTGSIGIEFLSRGAKQVVFCDESKNAVKIIQANLERVNFVEKSLIINRDYIQALKQLSNKFKCFDIIFVDPPYFNENFVFIAVKQVIEFKLLRKSGCIIVETDNETKIVKNLQKLEVNIYDIRKYGRVNLIFINWKE